MQHKISTNLPIIYFEGTTEMFVGSMAKTIMVFNSQGVNGNLIPDKKHA